MSKNKPTFAIIIPTYNEAKNIKSCLDSILEQTLDDWICYIIDDNSEDNTTDIIMDYVDKDSRFLYIKSEFKHYNPKDQSTFKDKDMSGISNMLNTGLQLASTVNPKYIIRMDMDDIMLKNRLQITYDYMEKNPDCDIAGFPFITDFGGGQVVLNLCRYDIDGSVENNHKSVSEYKTDYSKSIININNKQISELYKPYHPTLCMRFESVMKKMPYFYRQPYDTIEDTVLYYTANMWNCRIDLADTDPVIIYKIGKKHYKNQMEMHKRMSVVFNNEIINEYTKNSEFTVILTFRNEGIEVEKTIISLRYADPTVKFILVDDGSDDGYDYKNVADKLGCEYYRNKVSKGVAGARNEGVKHVKTPYFILMDAHMRLSTDEWDTDWSQKFINALKQDQNQIVVANTIIMHSNTEEEPKFRHYTNEDCFNGHKSFAAKCAYYHMAHDGEDWKGDWCYQVLDNDKYKWTQNKEKDLLVDCVSIMGATYATSVTWWNKIHGLNGLYAWGHDEPLLSLKTYLMGGKCRFFINWAVGHLYRDKPVYGVLDGVQSGANLLFIQYLVSKDNNEFAGYVQMLRERNKHGADYADKVIEEFNKHRQEYESERAWLWNNKVRTIDDVLEQQSHLCKV